MFTYVTVTCFKMLGQYMFTCIIVTCKMIGHYMFTQVIVTCKMLGHYMYSSASRAILLAPTYHQVEPHCLYFRLNVRATNCGGFRVFVQPTTALVDIPPKNISLDNMTSVFESPPDFCDLDLWLVLGLVL